MALLVNYSSGSESDGEGQAAASPVPPPKPATFNPKSIVKQSATRKIVVNLKPETEGRSGEAEAVEQCQSRPKKSMRDFNSLLPQPKNRKTNSGRAAESRPEQVPRTKPVGLKTGLGPSFSRDSGSGTESPVPSIAPDLDEVKLTGSVTMFRPLSIGRGGPKKKKRTAVEILAAKAAAAAAQASVTGKRADRDERLKTDISEPVSTPPSQNVPAVQPRPTEEERPKPESISLFSLPPKLGARSLTADYESEEEEEEEDGGRGHSEEVLQAHSDPQSATSHYQQYLPPSDTAPDQQGGASLLDLAQSLKLSKSEQRRLFGRHGAPSTGLGSSKEQAPAPNIVHFDTEEQYAKNESFRQSGAAVQHNPLRSIRAGKHSLQQLVSAATSQKEALEEHFAAGKRNRQDAGQRYGW